jgi:oligopeptide/dipeptide ABC transporter ATP-binding protein
MDTNTTNNIIERQQAILSARNVKVSFSTPAGRVQAVRGIDFDLYQGETLSIVGESGSGKSVTSKSILGLLSENADIERGEIVFDGLDLLKTNEKEFVDIRGEKISMIFQDPLSSLNPIVRIGKQLCESMIIKGKQKQKTSYKELNLRLDNLQKFMAENLTVNEDKKNSLEENKTLITKFRKFIKKQYQLENAYNYSRQEIEYCIEDIDKLLISIHAGRYDHFFRDVKRIKRGAVLTFNIYLVNKKKDEVLQIVHYLLLKAREIVKGEKSELGVISQKLERLREIMQKTLLRVKPNFFAMAYFVSFSESSLPQIDTKELNEYLQGHLELDFLNNFVEKAKQAIVFSHNKTINAKKQFVSSIDDRLKQILQEGSGRKKTMTMVKDLNALVQSCIDKLSNKRDSNAYAFEKSFEHEIIHYYKSNKNNFKEQRRFDKEKAKQEKSGEDYLIRPAGLIDLGDIKDNISGIVSRLKTNFERDLDYAEKRNFDMATTYMVEHIKDLAQSVVYKVTKEMAKRRSIRLMEEVGINEAERRFNQFPFEFSGGMRQRIVIAIALSSTPQILICDEPTTALDVTIQSQILELINDLKSKRGLSVIFITHDLGVVAKMADRVAVMYAGKIVEIGKTYDIFYDPKHPYTWALLGSMPDLDTEGKLDAIPGTPPNMIYPPVGDAYAMRNKYAMKIDYEKQPPMFKVKEEHFAATWLLHPQAPKVELPQVIKDRIQRNLSKFENTENRTIDDGHTLDVDVKVMDIVQASVHSDKADSDDECMNFDRENTVSDDSFQTLSVNEFQSDEENHSEPKKESLQLQKQKDKVDSKKVVSATSIKNKPKTVHRASSIKGGTTKGASNIKSGGISSAFGQRSKKSDTKSDTKKKLK